MLGLLEITSFSDFRLKFGSETEILYSSIHFSQQKRRLGQMPFVARTDGVCVSNKGRCGPLRYASYLGFYQNLRGYSIKERYKDD